MADKAKLTRRAVIGGLTVAALAGGGAWYLHRLRHPGPAPLGMDLSDDDRAVGLAFLKKHAAIDLHCHPGRFFLDDFEAEDLAIRALGGGFIDHTVADMAAGGLTAALFATVSDVAVIGLEDGGLRARRDFKPGEAYDDYKRQIGILKSLVARGRAAHADSPADIEAAPTSGQVAAMFACEGGDFLEGRLDRVAAAKADGVASIQLVHYRVNELGDIQTEEPRHDGLSPFGADVVREMNRLGLVVDVAHASFKTTMDVLEASAHPTILSHSSLVHDDVRHPRLITLEHARAVAEGGGVIGATPWGIGNKTLADFIDEIRRLVEAVGIDHVGIGTDMDAAYKPVFTNYRDLPLIPAAFKARGLKDDEIARIIGGNFMRVFEQIVS